VTNFYKIAALDQIGNRLFYAQYLPANIHK